MTQRITVVNNETGGPYDIEVAAFNKSTNDTEPDTRDINAGGVLKPGQSTDVYVHSHRYITVKEVK
jgi:hypothetical protein